MKEKFTKGKWEVDSSYGIRSNEVSVCEVYCNTAWLGNDTLALDPTEEHIANAHLISAAPEMYAMLDSIKEDYGIYNKVYSDIESLLAKSRGEK